MTTAYQKILVKYSILLFVGLVIEWWLVFYSPLGIPERIPTTPIKVDGVLLIIMFLVVFVKAEKEYIKTTPNAGVWELTGLGTLICFIAQIEFQSLRQPFLDAVTFTEHLYFYVIGISVVTCFCAFLSFFVAFQLKTKKTSKLVIIIIVFAVLINVVKRFFPSLFR